VSSGNGSVGVGVFVGLGVLVGAGELVGVSVGCGVSVGRDVAVGVKVNVGVGSGLVEENKLSTPGQAQRQTMDRRARTTMRLRGFATAQRKKRRS